VGSIQKPLDVRGNFISNPPEDGHSAHAPIEENTTATPSLSPGKLCGSAQGTAWNGYFGLPKLRT